MGEGSLMIFWMIACVGTVPVAWGLGAGDVTCSGDGLVKILMPPGDTAQVVMAMTSGGPCGMVKYDGGVLIDVKQQGRSVQVLLEHVGDQSRYDVIDVTCGGERWRRAASGGKASEIDVPLEGGEAKVNIIFNVGIHYANNSEVDINCDHSGILKVSNPDSSTFLSSIAFNSYGDECNTKLGKSKQTVSVTGCSLYKDIRVSFCKRSNHGNIIGGNGMNRVYLINCKSIWDGPALKDIDDYDDRIDKLGHDYYMENSATITLANPVMIAIGIFIVTRVM